MKDCTLSEASRICNRISDCRNCPFVDKEYVKCALVGMGTPATWQVDGWQVGVGNKVIKDERIKHEKDTLKEFVEWQAKQYKDLYYEYWREMQNETDNTDYFWCSGRVAGIGEIRKRLKQDLENFIKERGKSAK